MVTASLLAPHAHLRGCRPFFAGRCDPDQFASHNHGPVSLWLRSWPASRRRRRGGVAIIVGHRGHRGDWRIRWRRLNGWKIQNRGWRIHGRRIRGAWRRSATLFRRPRLHLLQTSLAAGELALLGRDLHRDLCPALGDFLAQSLDHRARFTSLLRERTRELEGFAMLGREGGAEAPEGFAAVGRRQRGGA